MVHIQKEQNLSPLLDRHGRQVQDLRIAITDRCNYRCFYCKPVHGFQDSFRAGIMSYEEIERITKLFVQMGVTKIRLTGGEPLLRRGIETLIAKLAQIPDLKDIALTTNAYLLPQKAESLREAGLNRLTISLDSLRPKRFHEITRDNSLDRVLKGLEAADKAGFPPLKINTVVIRGVNEDEVADFAKFARTTGYIVRFIEFMPLDEDHRWSRKKVFTQQEILEKIAQNVGPIEAIQKNYTSETASRYRFVDGIGEFGVIATVTAAFCGQCSRVRLTADGKLRTCLFSEQDHDLITLLRTGKSDQELVAYIRSLVWNKEAGHRINHEDFQQPKRSMSLIGG